MLPVPMLWGLGGALSVLWAAKASTARAATTLPSGVSVPGLEKPPPHWPLPPTPPLVPPVVAVPPVGPAPTQTPTEEVVEEILAEPALFAKLMAWAKDNFTPAQDARAAELVNQIAQAKGVAITALTPMDICPVLNQVLTGEQADNLEVQIPEMKEILDKCVPVPTAPVPPVVAQPTAPGLPPVIQITPTAPTTPTREQLIAEAARKQAEADALAAKLAEAQKQTGIVQPTVPVVPPMPPALPPELVEPAVAVVQPPPVPPMPTVPVVPVVDQDAAERAAYRAKMDELGQLDRVKTDDLIDVLNRQAGRLVAVAGAGSSAQPGGVPPRGGALWAKLKRIDRGLNLNQEIPGAFQAAVARLGLGGAAARIIAEPAPPGMQPIVAPVVEDWYVAPATWARLKANIAPTVVVQPPVPPQPTAQQELKTGAQVLRVYLVKNPTRKAFGFKGSPSRAVQAFQLLAQTAGFPDLVDDGILGPDVRDAASSVAVVLPERPSTAAPSGPAAPPADPTAPARRDPMLLYMSWVQENLTPAQQAQAEQLIKQYLATTGKLMAELTPKETCAIMAQVFTPEQAKDLGEVVPELRTTLLSCMSAPAPAPLPGPVTPTVPVVHVQPPAPSVPGPAGFDGARAASLAPAVASDISSKKYNYNRAQLRSFQLAAGVTTDGLYGGGSAGALRFYLGGANPPKPLFKPLKETPYTPPTPLEQEVKKALEAPLAEVVQPVTPPAPPAPVAAPVVAPMPPAPPPPVAPVPMPAPLLNPGLPDAVWAALTPPQQQQAIANWQQPGAGPVQFVSTDPMAPPPPPIAPAPIAPAPVAPSTELALAQSLQAFLTANPTRKAFGFRNNPSPPVVAFQQATGITPDGILGGDVRREGDRLGVTFPSRATAVSGHDPLAAKGMARQVVRNLRDRGRGYDRQLLGRFQLVAGLAATCEYDGETAGALQFFGSTRAPRPTVGPARAAAYAPPAI